MDGKRKRRKRGAHQVSRLGMIEEVSERVEDWDSIFFDKNGNKISDNKIVFTFPFINPDHAQIICTAINVDKELKPQIVNRVMEICNDNELKVTFDSSDLKQLRSSVTTFMENFRLAVESVMALDPNLPEHTQYDLDDPEIEILATPDMEKDKENN
jgi:tRNA threonylcarbamoyladenosine modification (KEOPS) complex  Pcc1 subunit